MGLRATLEHLVVHGVFGRRQSGGRVDVVCERQRCRTVGLRAALAHPELEVEVRDPSLIDSAHRFLGYVISYINARSARIRAGETLSAGSWLVRWTRTARGDLEAWDLDPHTTSEFSPGADMTVRFLAQQFEVCLRLGVPHVPTPANTLFSHEGKALSGQHVAFLRRAPSNGRHSGWFIHGSAGTQQETQLVTDHVGHLSEERPDLVRYLGLPVGAHVDLQSGERIAFKPDQ